MDSAKGQLADKLKSSNNVLVTVSRNPSVDQLAACIGLTLLLNKLGKHAAAVFSGQVPSTLEFLKPEDTIEKTTDSLRDFIIALDKSKADKLRYKVEDNVVRIFITPYRTSISQEDLEFSQGDFNVDVVVALGVQQQEDLDEAITAHGRILHDATVASINLANTSELGSINWQDQQASSLSELVTELAQTMKGEEELFDAQIATALLTGIVAETNRFSNEKTSSQTMSASAALMAAGANQQLVASELDMTNKPDDNASGNGAKLSDGKPPKSDDGTLEIDHGASDETATTASDTGGDGSGPALELPVPDAEASQTEEDEQAVKELLSDGPKLMTEAPTLGGQLTANTQVEGLDPSVDPLSAGAAQTGGQLLDHKPFAPPAQEDKPATPNFTPPPASWTPPEPSAPRNDLTTSSKPPEVPAPEVKADSHSDANPDSNQTLSEIEAAVGSAHLDSARDQVADALSGAATNPEPIQALNAQPLGGQLHQSDDASEPAASQPGPKLEDILSPNGANDESADPNTPQVTDSTAPPPVPPPIPFQFGAPNNQNPQQ